MTEPKFLLRALLASAAVGVAALFLVCATWAFAIPGPGGWAAWRVGLFASPFGLLVGVLAYLLWLDDQRTQWKKRGGR